MDDSEKNIAIEEWKMLQGIVQTQAELCFKVRTWCLTLLIGLIVGLYSSKTALHVVEFMMISLSLIIAFMWMEILQRVILMRATNRARKIEEFIRENANYDGPKVGLSLTFQGKSWKEKAIESIRLIKHPLVWGYNLMLFIIVIVAAKYSP